MRETLSRNTGGNLLLGLFLTALMVTGCSRSPENSSNGVSYRVAYNPYEGVDWEEDIRCLTQFHDHVESASHFYRFAYFHDEEGYQAICPLHYSGNPEMEKSWLKRYWPISKYTGDQSDEAFLNQFKNLRLLIPGGEEVGFHHILSLFMTDYIEKKPEHEKKNKYPFQYESSQACINRIRERGGLAVIAHPWNSLEHYDQYSDFQAIEVYSSYSNHKFLTGEREDTNALFLKVWDHLLNTHSTRIWGIGVNDWYGAGRFDLREEFPTHVDTGKTEVFIKDWSLECLRESFESGAMFAVKDRGIVKGDYPEIVKIEVNEESIRIDADSEVVWIANQTAHTTGETLHLSELPADLKYIRAQVHNATGEVFVQPFTLESHDG